MGTGGPRRWTAGRRARGGLAVAPLVALALALAVHAALAAPAAPTARAAPVARATAAHGARARAAAASGPVMTIHTDELAGPPYMGLGVEFDPYDPIVPTRAQWDLIFQRVDFMRPGFIRVVEAAYDYFGGYDANHNPTYRWNAPLVREMLTILSYAKSRGITVVLGDWENPMIGGDPRIPADFLEQLRDVYGFTNIRYYNLISEPNLDTGCDFGCWAGIVKALSSEFASMGLNNWLQLVGPDNANNYDDTQGVQAYDRTNGLDTDVPNGGDSWVTMTLQSVPSLIGAYDSHRYATPWGIENGVYEDQMRARREEISNLDSPSKPYFAGELGLVTATPQSQPAIGDFGYGVSMADLVIQAIDAGMSGASAWDLDDAMHNKGPYGSDDLKQWGFWNSLGGQDGYPASDLSLRPWYDTWSVLSRSFPAGSQPLAVPSSGIAGLRVAAAKIPRPGGYALSFAVVNDSDTPQSITLSVPSATGPLTLAQYDYFDGDRPTDPQGFPVPSQILPDTWLAGGVRVALPSRGVVVLSSVDVGSPSALGTSVGLNDGTPTLLDNLNDWHETAAHSAGLTLDHSNPALFNDDTSRAASATASPEYLTYRANQVTSFELKAYYQGTLGLRAYGSEDGATWTRIGLDATNPAPALGGGGSYLAELFPNGGLPAGTNELKIELTDPRTELSQVLIQYARIGPACTQPPRQSGRNDVDGVGLGTSRRTVLSLLGTPSTSGAQNSGYCVVGGGQLAFVFSQRNQVALIASTAPSYRPGGIGPGSSVAKLRRTLHRRLRGLGGGVFIARLRRTTVVVLARGPSVRAVAVATTAVLGSEPAAAAAIELAING